MKQGVFVANKSINFVAVVILCSVLLSSCSGSTSSKKAINKDSRNSENGYVVEATKEGCIVTPSLKLKCDEAISRDIVEETAEYLFIDVNISNESGRNLDFRPLPGYATAVLAESVEGLANPRLLSETHDFILTEEIDPERLMIGAQMSFTFLAEPPSSLSNNSHAVFLLVTYVDGEYTILYSNPVRIE